MAVLAAIIELLLALSMLAETEEILAESELNAGSCEDVADETKVCDGVCCASVKTTRKGRKKVI